MTYLQFIIYHTFGKTIQAALLSVLQIKAKVTLVAPKSITRSEGKAKRIIDTRKLHD